MDFTVRITRAVRSSKEWDAPHKMLEQWVGVQIPLLPSDSLLRNLSKSTGNVVSADDAFAALESKCTHDLRAEGFSVTDVSQYPVLWWRGWWRRTGRPKVLTFPFYASSIVSSSIAIRYRGGPVKFNHTLSSRFAQNREN